MQSNPTAEFSLFKTECNSNVISGDTKNNISRFTGLCEYGIRNNWLKAFERSLADFLPLLPTGDFKMGIINFVIKIIGGAVTFGLIAIALRRRFERRYRH